MGFLKRSRSTRRGWPRTGSKTTKRGAEIAVKGPSAVAPYPSLR